MSTEIVRARTVVGRDGDVARLADVVTGADQSTRGAIVVSGARGIGRTTVLDAAVGDLDAEPVRMLGVPCQATAPYASLVHTLNAAAGHRELGPLVPRWLDIIAAAGTSPAHVVARRMLTTLPRRPPHNALVQVIDDAHLLDRHSQEVVAYLAHHGAGFGLRSLLSVDEAAPVDSYVSLARHQLLPLGATDIRRVVEGVVEQPLPYRVAAVLHRWSGGNPALALDLSRQLSEAELAGTSPIGLPLVPSGALVRDKGERVRALPDAERRYLAVFAQCPTLRLELASAVSGCADAVVDRLVSGDWLVLHHRRVEPRRRLDALVAWASLPPSTQQDLNARLATALEVTRPAVADYFAAHSGDAAAAERLVARAAELYELGDPEPAAAVAALALHQQPVTSGRQAGQLGQLLVADGYVVAGGEELNRARHRHLMSETTWLTRLAELATMTGDPAEVVAHLHAEVPSPDDPDAWLQAVLMVCRLQLALDGPEESTLLVRSTEPLLADASAETRALAEVVAAERAVYREQPGSPAALHTALDAWLRQRSGGLDLPTVTAVVDLLGLGLVTAARDLLASLGPLQQLPFATSRSALLTMRVETEVAAGHYRRAAASLVSLDRERPTLSGADLVTTSQAIRISTVCDDLEDCRAIEARISRSTSSVLSYPARRAHTAALGFRELVLGNYAKSRDLLNLALQGPALLLQGRSCVLADLVEATAADGERAAAADLLDHHSRWLPDRDGDRSRGLLARCRAIVAAPDDVDHLFQRALAELPAHHETDRARTLLAYGRTLLLVGRAGSAGPVLNEALELFAEGQLPGWVRHVQVLQELCPQPVPAAAAEVTLTDLEQQVLALVMQRKRNREIAASLFVSLRTVEGHLTRIFRKLGVATKSELFRQVSAAGSEREPA